MVWYLRFLSSKSQKFNKTQAQNLPQLMNQWPHILKFGGSVLTVVSRKYLTPKTKPRVQHYRIPVGLPHKSTAVAIDIPQFQTLTYAVGVHSFTSQTVIQKWLTVERSQLMNRILKSLLVKFHIAICVCASALPFQFIHTHRNMVLCAMN